MVILFSSIVFKGLSSIVRVICGISYSATACKDIADNLATPMLRIGFDWVLNHETVCKRAGFCKYPIFVPDNEKDYIYRVLKDKPPVKRPIVNPNGEKFTFVIFADPHVDKHYEPGSAVECGLTVCCRGQNANTNQSFKQKAGRWGAVAKCDLPIVRK